MITLTTFIHFVWGVLLIVSDDTMKTSPMAGVGKYHLSANWMGGIFIFAAAMAMAEIVRWRWRWQRRFIWPVLLVVVQQFLLFLSAFGSISAVVSGQYADGYVAARLFILTDQLPNIAIACLHFVAVICHIRGEELL